MILSDNIEQTHLKTDDRGLAYGDGLFETIAYTHAKLQNWPAHYQRLQQGCQQLSLHCPEESKLLTTISKEVENALSKQTEEQPINGVVKLILTRGTGGRGYQYHPAQPQTLVISWKPWPDIPAEHYANGIEAGVCATRLAKQPLLAGIKHLNRLEQVLAKNELTDTAYAEGITLDYDDQLVEGTSSNLFFVVDGHLYTPVLDNCGVKGTLRALLLQTAKHYNIPVSEGSYALDDLKAASELFFTNSLVGIYPVSGLTFSANDHKVYTAKTIMHTLSKIINRPLQRPVIN